MPSFPYTKAGLLTATVPASTSIEVRVAVAGGRYGALATLYTSADKTATASNPVTSTAGGALPAVYAVPGDYVLIMGTQTRTISAYPDATEDRAEGLAYTDDVVSPTDASATFGAAKATALGSVSGVVNVDCSSTAAWTATLTGDVTFNLTNVPTTLLYEPSFTVTQGGAGTYTVSFAQDSSLISPQWTGAGAPLVKTGVGETTELDLSTKNGGAAWSGTGQPSSPLTDGLWTPADFGLIGWAGIPNLVTASKQPTAGQLWCTKIKVQPRKLASRLVYYLSTLASGASNSYLGVYDETGAKLAASVDLSGTDFIGANSFYRSSTVSPFTTPDNGRIIVAVLVGAGTVPTFAAMANSPAAANAINQDGTKGYGVFTYGSGLTALPASLTLSAANCTIAAQALQFGVA